MGSYLIEQVIMGHKKTISCIMCINSAVHYKYPLYHQLSYYIKREGTHMQHNDKPLAVTPSPIPWYKSILVMIDTPREDINILKKTNTLLIKKNQDGSATAYWFQNDEIRKVTLPGKELTDLGLSMNPGKSENAKLIKEVTAKLGCIRVADATAEVTKPIALEEKRPKPNVSNVPTRGLNTRPTPVPLNKKPTNISKELPNKFGPTKNITDFTGKKVLLHSAYNSISIIDHIPTEEEIKQTNSFLLVRNKSDGKFNLTAHWFENNQFKVATLQEADLKDINLSSLELENLEIKEKSWDDPSLINKITKKLGCIQGGAHDRFIHETSTMRKKPPEVNKESVTNEELPEKFKNKWFMKRESCWRTAITEVVAQETLRMINPDQPKTRLIPSLTDLTAYVASKEVPGFTSFEKMGKLKMTDIVENSTGFGKVCVAALFLNEGDFKPGNVGRDINGNIVKIDGDWCFTILRLLRSDKKDVERQFKKKTEDLNFDITDETLNSLPRPINYDAWNWLDFIIEKECKNDPSYTSDDISMHPKFLRECNEAKLIILLLSDELLETHINTWFNAGIEWLKQFDGEDDYKYIEPLIGKLQEDAKKIYGTLLDRKASIKKSALANDSFIEFIQSDDAKIFIYEHKNHLKNFTTTQKNHLKVNIDEMINEEFGCLLSVVKQNKMQRKI